MAIGKDRVAWRTWPFDIWKEPTVISPYWSEGQDIDQSASNLNSGVRTVKALELELCPAEGILRAAITP